MNCRGCPTAIDPEKSQSERLCSCASLHVFDWMNGINEPITDREFVEVRFKNTRKQFYINENRLPLEQGDIVAVEASPGHDIGIVSLRGPLVLEQMRKYNIDPAGSEFKIIYRKTKPADIEKWLEAIGLENTTMLKAREMAERLNLNMKIGDVEYQGDKTRAIFYYIADERVDFRELIKLLAEEFRIRVEMRQIGARQEAGRIGGIGPCGRELCCNSWLTNFKSVTTNAARIQEISLNPQKLAGQCGKLKCCINYEVDCYNDAKKDFPDISVTLETQEGKAYYQKADVFKKILWYSFESNETVNLIPVPLSRVQEIVRLNTQGTKPEKLTNVKGNPESNGNEYKPLEAGSLDRFESQSRSKKKKKKRKKSNPKNNSS
jgi:cell fate regulator YaaT (PSP1 superfamily)